MRNILIAILFLIGLSFSNQGGYTYREVKYGESLVVSYDNNMGEIDWDNSGKKIVFVSKSDGKAKIYYLNLFSLPINFTRNGFHSAKYVNDLVNKDRVFKPVMGNGADTAFSAPKWNLNGRKILAIGNCKNQTEIFIADGLLKGKREVNGTKIKNVSAAHWKNDSTFYVVFTDRPRQLVEISRRTKEKKVIAETKHPIIGISKQKSALYLSVRGGTYEYSFSTKKVVWYELPVNGTTIWRLGRLNFVGLNYSGSAQVLDLNNAITHPFSVGDNDGPPAISRDEKFVAFYSGYVNGIIIKRLDKKFFLE